MHHELLAQCWPLMREHSPCSSIHPITPAHILGLTGGTLKKRTAKISHCRLYFARRWDLKRQILSFLGPTPPPCFRYGPPQSISRPGWCCPVVGPTSRMCCIQGTAQNLPRGVLAIPSKDCLTTHTTSRTQWRTSGTARLLWLELVDTF